MPYTPGSPAGYALGVAGGLMMLVMFLYSLRKRVRALHVLGRLQFWFRAHMVLGIAGPTLVLFHSTFTVRSLNAAVALACMLLVAGSGIVGRFLYARIHNGLYGANTEQEELRARLESIEAKLGTVAGLSAPLLAFSALAGRRDGGALARAWRFATLSAASRRALRACRDAAKPVLRKRARAEGWSDEQLVKVYGGLVRLCTAYLDAAKRSAQLEGYRRLFSLWHVAHVPFVYMLVVSAVVHVLAVHMY